jgi:gliding motility-associated-like protein
MESSLTTPYIELEANNMITPNGDGINDTWIVKNIHSYPNNELNIFDRDGRVVFTMIGYDNLWNGQFNGKPLSEGTYYYILYIDSGKAKKTGFISIVKQ